MPKKDESKSKHVWISFYNEEAEKDLKEYWVISRKEDDSRLFTITKDHVTRIFRKTSEFTGVKISDRACDHKKRFV